MSGGRRGPAGGGDLRLKDLYRTGKKFELMQRAMGFAALAILTVIPLLIVVAAANPDSHRGLGGWVVYGMGLTGSAAGAVARLFSAPGRVLGTTSVFSAVVLAVSGVAFAGSVQAGFERIWGLPAGPWHKIWRQAVWVVGLVAYIYAAATVGTVTHGGPAETAVRVAVAVVLGIAFFWWGLRFLTGGRVSYLAAMPGAVATIAGLAGLRVFSGLVFEPLIASNAVSYGALGSFLIVQSWLIGVGWVIYGGQLFGRWFHDAKLQPWADRRRGRAEPGGGAEGEQEPEKPSHLLSRIAHHPKNAPALDFGIRQPNGRWCLLRAVAELAGLMSVPDAAVLLTMGSVSSEPVADHDQHDVIRRDGEMAVVLPMYEYRRLRALEQRASANDLDAAEADAVLQAHDEWVAAGRPGAMSHEEFMAELLGGIR